MIGVTTPIFTYLLTFVQGLAIGGQWGGGTMLLVTESAPHTTKGFYGALLKLGSMGVIIFVTFIFIQFVSGNVSLLGMAHSISCKRYFDWN